MKASISLATLKTLKIEEEVMADSAKFAAEIIGDLSIKWELKALTMKIYPIFLRIRVEEAKNRSQTTVISDSRPMGKVIPFRRKATA